MENGEKSLNLTFSLTKVLKFRMLEAKAIGMSRKLLIFAP